MKFKVLILLMMAAAGLSLAMSADAQASEAHPSIYYCPMHPQVVSDKPGECPICHMRLVKRGEESAHVHPPEHLSAPDGRVPAGYSTLTIDPRKQQLIGIRTAPVARKPIAREIGVPARVAYDPELYQAQIDYLREYRMAKGSLRGRELAFKNLQDSRWEAPRIEQAKSRLLLMGMDEESIAQLVESAKADEALLYLNPEGAVWVFAEVFEMDAPWLRKGDAVTLEIPGTGKTYEARVHSIGSFVDPDTRRIHVHIGLQNDGTLKPGMLLNARIRSAAGEGLAVPDEAVFFTGRNEIVFVDKGDGVFEPRRVKVGARSGDDYEILEGLREGEKAVVSGNFLLDSESRLKASIEQAASAHAGHGGAS